MMFEFLTWNKFYLPSKMPEAKSENKPGKTMKFFGKINCSRTLKSKRTRGKAKQKNEGEEEGKKMRIKRVIQIKNSSSKECSITKLGLLDFDYFFQLLSHTLIFEKIYFILLKIDC